MMFRIESKHRGAASGAIRAAVAMLSFTVAALVFIVANSATGVTEALWNKAVTVSTLSVTSGSLGLTVNGGSTAALSGASWSKMLPGDVVSQQVTVANTGSVPAAVTVRTTGSFGSTLVAIAKGVCGAVIGGTSSTVSATSLGTFTAGESSTVCVQLTLPATVASAVQGTSSTFDVVFTATAGS